MRKFYEDLLSKYTTVLTSPFSDIPVNQFGFHETVASGLGKLQLVAIAKSLY